MEQNECINPDCSLAEMYHIRNTYKNRIRNMARENEKEPEIFKNMQNSLAELNKKIEKVEHAGQTGGMIRIM